MNGCAYLGAVGYAPVISWVLTFDILFVFPRRIRCFWTCALSIETLVSRKINFSVGYSFTVICVANQSFRSLLRSRYWGRHATLLPTKGQASRSKATYFVFFFVPELKDAFEVLSVGKESYVFRASTSREYRRWLKYLRLESKELGAWKRRRNGLPNIMIKNL